MNLEQLLRMSEEELKREHSIARRENNIDRITLINTIRIGKIILSSLQKFDTPKSNLTYYEHGNRTYFVPKVTEYIPSVEGDIEWLILAHISSSSPISVDINLLQELIASDRIEFLKSPDEIKLLPQENVMNYTYLTEDRVGINLPDVWVPNGEEELQIAVADMPKEDSEAVLLTNCSSYLTIGNYVTSNRTFTDVFYAHNGSENSSKAIILNDIAGIDVSLLERELQKQGVSYIKEENLSPHQSIATDKIPIDLDLSTIWTAKYPEIIEDAISDSQERENFSPSPVKIHDMSCQIVTSIEYGGQKVGITANYNTVILFDDKLLLFDADVKDRKREELTKLFLSHGIPSIVTEEPIDLSPFESGSKVGVKK